MRPVCVSIAVVTGLCPVAMGDVAGLNFWDARVGFGVFADGGNFAPPDQGQAALSPGTTQRLWHMTDGVAYAQVRAESTLSLEQSATRLWMSLQLTTVSQADVGDNPEYELERGVAEAYLESAMFDVTVLQASILNIQGSAFGSYGIGTHLLDPGEYTLDLSGTLARSNVDVGANGTGMNTGFLMASFELTPVPAPGTAALLGVMGTLAARRRRA